MCVCISFSIFHVNTDESGCETDMAEGIEEAENNSNSGAGDATTSMISAAMPCEIINPTIGSLKREFDSYHQSLKRSKTSSPSPTPPLATSILRHHHSPDPINYHHQQQQQPSSKQRKQFKHYQIDDEQDNQSQSSPQQQPINLKSEVIVFRFSYFFFKKKKSNLRSAWSHITYISKGRSRVGTEEQRARVYCICLNEIFIYFLFRRPSIALIDGILLLLLLFGSVASSVRGHNHKYWLMKSSVQFPYTKCECMTY